MWGSTGFPIQDPGVKQSWVRAGWVRGWWGLSSDFSYASKRAMETRSQVNDAVL